MCLAVLRQVGGQRLRDLDHAHQGSPSAVSTPLIAAISVGDRCPSDDAASTSSSISASRSSSEKLGDDAFGFIPTLQIDHAASLVRVEPELGHDAVEKRALLVGDDPVGDNHLGDQQALRDTAGHARFSGRNATESIATIGQTISGHSGCFSTWKIINSAMMPSMMSRPFA